LAAKQKEAQAGENTLRAVVEEYFKREGRKHRTERYKRATLERLVLPKFGARQIEDIKKSDIVKLLDRVEDRQGRFMADKTLGILGAVLSWHEKRSDDYVRPIMRGMMRTELDERTRARILSDDELRTIWKAAEATNDIFSRLIRFILLTATRRNEAKNMTWAEVDGRDWVIPAKRYKINRDTLIPLSAKARALLDRMPKIGPGDWVFTISGRVHLGSTTEMKRAFERDSGVTGWRIHDLRRTARSLMSRAGVDADIAERCLGHKLRGIRGVYDRYEYRDEKAHAFEALAAQIERIVDPQPNVVAITR
jgi:integrase